jgi:hypothetical protein
MRVRLRRASAPVLLLLAACRGGPGIEAFDPAALSQRTSDALATLEEHPALQSMNVLGQAFTLTGAPAFAPIVAPARAVGPAALLPATALGKTFGYSSQTGRYEPGEQPGAPANGVRFLLYQVESGGGTVVQPLEEIGFIQITDESGPSANTLGITGSLGGVTVLDYDASGSLTSMTLSFSAEGYVTDDTRRIDFDLSHAASLSTGLQLDYRISAPAQGVSVRLVGSSQGGATVTNVALTITEGGNEAEISASGGGEALSGSVKFNGRTVASISGSDAAPVFGAHGDRVLTAEDLAGLLQLFHFASRAFEAFDDLLYPAYFVFGF